MGRRRALSNRFYRREKVADRPDEGLAAVADTKILNSEFAVRPSPALQAPSPDGGRVTLFHMRLPLPTRGRENERGSVKSHIDLKKTASLSSPF